MSRIRFEWDLESHRIDRSDGEEPGAKRMRRRNALRLLVLVILLLAALSISVIFIRQRLIDVENYYAQLLQDTVKSEVAALRVGDRDTFLAIQDVGNEAWLQMQSAVFGGYADLKAAGKIELTGSILEVEIADDRARVVVQENISDAPYARLWFYRRSERGWRHVPPDYSFWGEQRQQQADGLSVVYRRVDERLASQLAQEVSDWLKRGCGLLDCGDLPALTVEIVTDSAEAVAWRNEGAMQLRLRSPYLDIARADLPFDGNLRIRVGQLLAERLVNAHTDFRPVLYPADSYYLRQSAIAWLTEYMTRLERDSGLVGSLALNYGADKIPLLLSALSSNGDLSIIQQVTSTNISQANLDWREFIEWRLLVESELLAAGAQDQWLMLYDTADEAVRLLAYERYRRREPVGRYRVLDQLIWTRDDGSPQLRVTALAADGRDDEEIIIFNLVNGVWKRAN